MKYFRSYTKNWPGGRKNAIIIETRDECSFQVWNHKPVSFTRPYLPPPDPPSQGGMAEPDKE